MNAEKYPLLDKVITPADLRELDEDQLFYLRSRGLDEASARQLLVEGFIADLFEAIENEALRAHLGAIARTWLEAS